MKFDDDSFDIAALVYHGATELQPADICERPVLDALARWESRNDPCASDVATFHLDHCRCFAITYTGESDGHWPNKEDNLIGEILIRRFLFPRGICNLEHTTIRLFRLHYTVLALDEYEYLLVCPYETESGNLAGLTVVCVNRFVSDPGAGPR